jgi:plastocyanin
MVDGLLGSTGYPAFLFRASKLVPPRTGKSQTVAYRRRMTRSPKFPAAAAVGLVVLGGCAPGGHTNEAAARKKQVEAEAAKLPPPQLGHELSTDDGSPAGTIEVKNLAFSPASFTITAGQAILWKFDDGAVTHRVTGDGFDSAPQTSGLFSHTFAAAGTFAYRCAIHPTMKGTVTVTGR